MEEPPRKVLIVDDDDGIGSMVQELLEEEGYAIEILRDRRLESVQITVERLRPDCVLLDGEIAGTFGSSWAEAAWLSARCHRVPVIMFSADARATDEAQLNESERSQAAGFSSVLRKPFDLDEMVRVVALAVSQSPHRLET